MTPYEHIIAALMASEIKHDSVTYRLADGVDRVSVMVDDEDDEDRRIELLFTEANGYLTGILSAWKKD